MSDVKKLNSKVNLDKSIKGFFTKKKIILSSLTSVLVSVPITIGITQIMNDKGYTFHGQSFSNLSSAVDYVKNNSTVSQHMVEGNNSKWKLSLNNEVKIFNTPEELRAYVYDNFVKVQSVNTNLDFSKFENEKGALNINGDFWKNIYDGSSNLNKTVYQGLNDIAYDNEESAKKSYFQVKDGYQFNGIYFQTKEQLNNYLINNYLPSQNNSFNSIVIEGPNGTKSNAINLSGKNAMAEISEFVSNNAEKVLSYTNSTNKKTFDISSSNVNNIINDVNVKDLDYIHMYTNEGQSRYVIDNSIYDDNNLIGPYFYNGNLDVGSFMNKNMWRKTTGIKKSSFLGSKIDDMIGNFFTSVINDDNVLNIIESDQDKKIPPIFRTMLYLEDINGKTREGKNSSETEKPKKTSLDDWYVNKINELSPKLSKEIENTNRTLLGGKRYNTFFKIPIMYSFIMQRIVSYNLGNEILNLTIDYFSRVADFIQDAIDIVTLYDKDILTRDDGKVFNVKEFFQIGNPEYNLNTSTEYFLNEIKTYSKLVSAMSTYVGATNSIMLTTGLLPFDSYDQSYLFDFGIIEKDQYYKDETKYKAIYDSFSTLSYAEMLNVYIPNSKNQTINSIKDKPKSEWDKSMEAIKSNFSKLPVGSLLKGIGMKNTEYHDLARALLNTEIRLFNETNAIMHDGYLSKLYNPDSKKDRLGPFMTLIHHNQTIDTYRVYIALVADIRSGGRVYNNPNDIVDKNAFIKNISRLVGFAFGSAYMVGTTVNQIFKGYSKYRGSYSVNRASALSGSESSWATTWAGPDSSSNNGWMRDAMVGSVPSVTNHPLFKHFSNKANTGNGSVGSWGGGISGDINRSNSIISRAGSNHGSVSSNQSFTMKDLEPIYAKVNKPYNPDPDFLIGRVFSFLTDHMDRDEWHIWDGGAVYTGVREPIYESFNGSVVSRQSIVSPFHEASSISGDNWERASSNGLTTNDFPAAPTETPKADRVASSKRMKWSGKATLLKIKDYASIAANVLGPLISTGLFGLEIFFLISDFVSENYTQEFYVYTTADGTEFIWDGGLTVSKYLGLETRQLSGIDKMKLLRPIQVTLPQVEDFYYYNGVKYYDPNLLKKDQLTYLLQNNITPTSKQFKVKYTLSNTSNNKSFDSIESLLEDVIADLGITKNNDGTYNFKNINKGSTYLSKTSFAFSNGLTTDENNSQIAISRNVLENIRTTKIVMLPKKDATTHKANGRTDEFVYPGKYWDGSKVVENNDKSREYIIDNSANELKAGVNNTNRMIDKSDYAIENIAEAEKKSQEKLYSTFKTKLAVNQKTTIVTDVINKNKFNEMSDSVSKKNLYVVKLPGQESMYFATMDKAQTYAIAYLKFQKDADMKNQTIYNYNGMTFNSIDEIIEWIKLNSI